MNQPIVKAQYRCKRATQKQRGHGLEIQGPVKTKGPTEVKLSFSAMPEWLLMLS